MPGLYHSQTDEHSGEPFTEILRECCTPFDEDKLQTGDIICPILSSDTGQHDDRSLKDQINALVYVDGCLKVLSLDEMADKNWMEPSLYDARSKAFDHSIEVSGISVACWAATNMRQSEDDLSVFVTPHAAILIFHPCGAFAPGGPSIAESDASRYLKAIPDAIGSPAYIYTPHLTSSHEKIEALGALPQAERLTTALMRDFLPAHPAHRDLEFDYSNI
jgi:hypothetical protein